MMNVKILLWALLGDSNKEKPHSKQAVIKVLIIFHHVILKVQMSWNETVC
jgi:hypothetical protein